MPAASYSRSRATASSGVPDDPVAGELGGVRVRIVDALALQRADLLRRAERPRRGRRRATHPS